MKMTDLAVLDDLQPANIMQDFCTELGISNDSAMQESSSQAGENFYDYHLTKSVVRLDNI